MTFLGKMLDDFKKNIPQISEYASLASDLPESKNLKFFDTGSYIVNALLSTSIYGGIPSGMVTAIAGKESSGKTFIALKILQLFLAGNKDAESIIFETEGAITREMLEKRKVDTSRTMIVPVGTVEEFRTAALRVLNNYMEIPEKGRTPLLLVLDSLGQLSTEKEMQDISDNKSTRDMTRAGMIKAAFRVITLKASKCGVPVFITSHTYASLDAYKQDPLSGGSGLLYAASSIIVISNAKEKNGNDVVGKVIHCNLRKSRISCENKKVDALLRYDTGLQRYYGLVELACEGGIFRKISTKVEVPVEIIHDLVDNDAVKEKLKELKVGAKKSKEEDGVINFLDDDNKRVAYLKGTTLFLVKTFFISQINADPERFFTKDVLDMIDAFAQVYFAYGAADVDFGVDTDDEPDVESETAEVTTPKGRAKGEPKTAMKRAKR